MRRIRYGVAASLDGYIAGPNGEYDWIPIDPEIDFTAMAAQFDAYLMGRRTYELAASNGGAHLPNAELWVFSRTLRPEDHPGVTIVAADAAERLRELRERPGKDIALFGGGDLFRNLLALGQVDTVEVAVVPVLLGGGIPLLPSPAARSRIALTNHRVYPKTGTVLLEYEVRSAANHGASPASQRRGRPRRSSSSP
jgi:dihydrofolate reductase